MECRIQRPNVLFCAAVMRPVHRFALWSLCLGTVACGATAPRALAEPRDAHKGESLPPPLIAGELRDDAEMARAIRENYTKYEFRIPMRDGARLFTAVYVPKDHGRTYPIMLTRTPYAIAPYGIDSYPNEQNARALRRFAPSTRFIREGYVFVHQDVRGRMMSEGTFVDVRPHAASGAPAATPGPAAPAIDESTDAWDTIDWLVKNVPRNNGRVGIWGISYPGFYAAQAAVSAHPALKAVSPQAPVTEWFLGDDFHHNGAFFVADAFRFYSNFGRPRPEPTKKSSWTNENDGVDAYDFFLAMGPLANANAKFLKSGIPFWNDLMAHGTRDAFWKERDPRPFYKDVKPAVMTVGGWFDAEDCFGALETYRAFEKQSPRADNTIVMGPWRHGGWARNDGDHLGDVTFGAKTSLYYRDKIEFPFFDHHLRGAPAPAKTEAWMFETGTNEWQRYDAWPPRESKPRTLFFHAGGKLGVAPPVAGEDATGLDAYVSDPNKPVPYRGKVSVDIEADYMTDDQRFAARRPDVLVYSTPELDGDVTLSGPLTAKLWVETTGTDADFVVKLVDVYPADHPDPEPNPGGVKMGGYQQLVRGEIMRGKFRKSFEAPEPFKPGEPALVTFSLPDVAHTFRAGHKLMVQVQSSWFPLVDRNPQTFTDIYAATDADFRVATHKVHRHPGMESAIQVSVLRGALPSDSK